MPLQPSRRDVFGPPKRDVSDLSPAIRHHESYLRSLDPGITGGRFATPRPPGQGGGSQLVGDDGDGGDGCDPVGEDGDRLTLANLSTQVWTLSYTPISETLHVHWHPNGGAGVEWKRGEHYELSEDDQIVTIYASALVTGRAEIGDVFSAQYLRLDCEEDDPVEPPEPVTATVRGSAFAHYGSSDPIDHLALPAGTQIGDMIAVTTNRNIADGRMTYAGGASQLWLGYATTLADLGVDMSSDDTINRWCVAMITLDTNAVSWVAGGSVNDLTMHPGDFLPIPEYAGANATLATMYSTHGIVDGAFNLPVGYSTGAGSGTAKAHVRVDLWVSPNESISPSGPAAFLGGAGKGYSAVVGLIGP
jgi:hypothetical protein